MVHGAGAAQALLRAGQLDELELHVVPVLLGQGRRLFDNLPAEHIELSLVRRLTTSDVEELAQHVTHLRYSILRPARRSWRRSASTSANQRQQVSARTGDRGGIIRGSHVGSSCSKLT